MTARVWSVVLVVVLMVPLLPQGAGRPLVTTGHPIHPPIGSTSASLAEARATFAKLNSASELPLIARELHSAIASDTINYSGTYRVAYPTEDLDGDSAPDILVVNWDEANGKAQVEARSGFDGSLIWTRGFDQLVFLSPMHERVFVETFSIDQYQSISHCETPTFCTSFVHQSFHWTVAALDSRTGLDQWEREYAGNLTYVGQTDSIGQLGISDITNYLVVPFLAGGEAILDIFSRLPGNILPADSTDVIALSNGSLLGSHQPHPSGYDSFALPVGNALGNGSEDLLVEEFYPITPGYLCTAPNEPPLCTPDVEFTKISLIDGKTFVEAWSRTFDHPPWVEPALTDLDGDGASDLFWYSNSDTMLISGRNGSDLWGAHVQGLARIAGPGLLIATHASVAGRLIDRINATTGHITLETELIVPGRTWTAWSLVYAGLMDGGEGNGVLDYLYSIMYQGNNGEMASEERLVSGGNGSLVFSRTTNDFRHLMSLGDITGDGLAEAMEMQYVSDGNGWAVTFAPTRLSDGVPLWSVTQHGSPSARLWFKLAGDVNGDGRRDIAFYFNDIDWTSGVTKSRVDVVNSTNGAPLWRIGDLPS